MICTEQEVYCCGRGDNGQLGLGRRLMKQVKPTALPRFKDQEWDETIEKIVCDETHTFFLMNSRNIFVCGDNSNS